MVARKQTKEGKGIGEVISESIVYIVVLAALAFAGRWYFFVFRASPAFALQQFIGAVNAGNYKGQYALLSSDAKASFGSAGQYDDKSPLAHGFSARIQNYNIDKVTETGERAEADVTLNMRKSTDSLLASDSEKFNDHYVLKKESDGWKVSLSQSKLTETGSATKYN
jgi:hypothetical protein